MIKDIVIVITNPQTSEIIDTSITLTNVERVEVFEIDRFKDFFEMLKDKIKNYGKGKYKI
jgi:hypothetical protein